jgi:putative sigma-54 modulation protein
MPSSSRREDRRKGDGYEVFIGGDNRLEFSVTTRHFEPAEEFRSFVERKVRTCVEKYFPKAVEAHVTVSMEGHGYIAEIDIKIRGVSFHARGEMRDLHSVTEMVMEKIETQMRRYKERRKSHKQ